MSNLPHQIYNNFHRRYKEAAGSEALDAVRRGSQVYSSAALPGSLHQNLVRRRYAQKVQMSHHMDEHPFDASVRHCDAALRGIVGLLCLEGTNVHEANEQQIYYLHESASEKDRLSSPTERASQSTLALSLAVVARLVQAMLVIF